MLKWRRVDTGNGNFVYKGPNGERYGDLYDAYQHEVAEKAAFTGQPENRLALSFLLKFLRMRRREGGARPDIGTDELHSLRDVCVPDRTAAVAPPAASEAALHRHRLRATVWHRGDTPAAHSDGVSGSFV